MQADRLLVVGRFQPPHLGHLSLIKYSLGVSRETVVVVGSAQESHTLENPMTAGERVEALNIMLSETLGDDFCKRVKIVPVMDIAMNKVWVQYLTMLLPKFDGVVSGNELVLMLFEDMGFKAIKPPMYNRDVCSGTEIRRAILEGSNWASCIHPSVKKYLESIGFVERVKRLGGASDG